MEDGRFSPSAEFHSARAADAAPALGSSSRSDAEHAANAFAAQEAVLREQARRNLARTASGRIVASSLEQIRSQLRLSMAACRTAGIPLDDPSGGLSYRILADEFESATMLENPSPADLDAMVARVANSTRQLVTMWKTASGSSPPDDGRPRGPPGSASGGPGPAPAPPEASFAPFPGVRAREASPTPSSASAATAAPALKRARVVASDVAAAAAAAAGAKLVTIGDNWAHDVKIFFPELASSYMLMQKLVAASHDLLRTFVVLPESGVDIDDMPADEFMASALVADPEDSDPEAVRAALRACVDRSSDFFRALEACRVSAKRTFNLYQLASMRKHASWLTVAQLQFREQADAQEALFDPGHRPLANFDDKVAAALLACEQQGALAKDGSLVGPISPIVAAHLAARARGSRGRGDASVARGAGRHNTGGNGRRKQGAPAVAPPRGEGGGRAAGAIRGGGANKKRSRPARPQGDAAAPPPAPAGGGAPAAGGGGG